MKKLRNLLSVMVMTLIAISISAFPSYAEENSARNGIVYIESKFVASHDQEFIFDYGGIYAYAYAGEEVSFRGTGFAIGKPGEPVSYIVTNAHVVLDNTAEGIKSIDPLNQNMTLNSNKATEVKVYFSKAANDFMYAQIYMVNEEKDICVLKLPEPTEKREPLVICKSTDIDMDDSFAAIGFPASSDGFMDDTSLKYDISDVTKTTGGISRKSTDINGVEVYQIDIKISSGNSGGALVNSKGQVVGITTYAVGDRNYAIVIDELLNLISRDTVEYTLSTELSVWDTHGTLLTIIIIAGVVVIAAVVVIIIFVKRKPKKNRPRAPKNRQAVITGIKGVLTGQSFVIDGSVTIGRNAQKCSVCYPVNTKGVSGVHCEIRQCGNDYQIVDLGSSCGTFLSNGQKLVPNVPVTITDDMCFLLGGQSEVMKFNIKQ
ncbi:MAG: trypsin-like peptidase domain-containing protein [Oscillospiraceae bacterium]|nr:trypsin-like peptidase domain-containing protein [Oscillospiraceae bacterium]